MQFARGRHSHMKITNSGPLILSHPERDLHKELIIPRVVAYVTSVCYKFLKHP